MRETGHSEKVPSDGQATRTDPIAEYTAPEEEWTALLTLAGHSAPARAVTAGGWRADFFASPGAADAFARLAEADTPQMLDVPATVEGAITPAPVVSQAEIDAVRERLAQWAQVRMLAHVERNLARWRRDVEATGKPSDAAAYLSASRTALDRVARLTAGHGAPGQTIATLGELIAGYWQRVAEQRHAAPSGLAGLDKALGGGLQPRRLAVLLGAPGSGKTTLANQLAEHVASSGRPVVYLTTEDTPDTLLAKTLARMGGIEYGAVLQGRESERSAITAALAALYERPSAHRLLYVEGDGLLTLDSLRALTREHFGRYDASAGNGGGPGVLVVDYLQRWARLQRTVSGMREELREAVGRVTEQLRDMARELSCTVIALASQNRASGYGKNADALASAKESGDIEYTADVVLALALDEKRSAPLHHEARTLRIDKNRQGQTDTLAMDWYPARQTWTEAERC